MSSPPEAKRGRGRPRLDDPRIPLAVRLNSEERAALRKHASDAGVSESTWARNALRRALRLGAG